jgi:hypothetical protein
MPTQVALLLLWLTTSHWYDLTAASLQSTTRLPAYLLALNYNRRATRHLWQSARELDCNCCRARLQMWVKPAVKEPQHKIDSQSSPGLVLQWLWMDRRLQIRTDDRPKPRQSNTCAGVLVAVTDTHASLETSRSTKESHNVK